MPATPTSGRRRERAVARGSSLIEVMAAIGVMLVGAAGLAGLNKMGLRMDGDGKRITRATAIAEDLAQQIQLWPYGDPRLSNPNTTNDDDPGDSGFRMEGLDPTKQDPLALVDHVEADLTAGGTVWNGIPTDDVVSNGYERYWNVSMNDPGNPGHLLDANNNGVADGKRIAVIVRYRTDTGWRRIVMLTLKVSDENDR